MSRAFQRAKERKNRTLDELVMDKTVKQGWLRCQVPDIRARAGNPGPDVQNRADLVLQEPDVRPGTRMSSPMAQMSGSTNPDLVWGRNFRIGGGN